MNNNNDTDRDNVRDSDRDGDVVAIAAEDNPFYIEDIRLIDQECTSVKTDIDGGALAQVVDVVVKDDRMTPEEYEILVNDAVFLTTKYNRYVVSTNKRMLDSLVYKTDILAKGRKLNSPRKRLLNALTRLNKMKTLVYGDINSKPQVLSYMQDIRMAGIKLVNDINCNLNMIKEIYDSVCNMKEYKSYGYNSTLIKPITVNNMIYQLINIIEEYGEYSIDMIDDKLCIVVTKHITMRPLDDDDRDYGCDSWDMGMWKIAYNVDNNTCSAYMIEDGAQCRNENIIYNHPHINSNGVPCMGDIETSLYTYQREGMIAANMGTVVGVLERYNRHSPYIEIEVLMGHESEEVCSICGSHYDISELHRCNYCDRYVCHECSTGCAAPYYDICDDCMGGDNSTICCSCMYSVLDQEVAKVITDLKTHIKHNTINSDRNGTIIYKSNVEALIVTIDNGENNINEDMGVLCRSCIISICRVLNNTYRDVCSSIRKCPDMDTDTKTKLFVDAICGQNIKRLGHPMMCTCGEIIPAHSKEYIICDRCGYVQCKKCANPEGIIGANIYGYRYVCNHCRNKQGQ